ncbi:hypothetical protein ALC62_09587, partial [Cyphomyrmex costatus]
KIPKLTKRSCTQIHHCGKARARRSQKSGITMTDGQHRPFIKMKTKTVVAAATATATTRRRRRRNSVRPAKYSLVVLKIPRSGGVEKRYPRRARFLLHARDKTHQQAITSIIFSRNLCLSVCLFLLEIGHDLAKARVISVNK